MTTLTAASLSAGAMRQRRSAVVVSAVLGVLAFTAWPNGAFGQIEILHSFNLDDGATMQSGVVTDGATLYGAALGGPHKAGTLYAANPDGTNFRALHNFTGLTGDGSGPYSRPLLDGSTLYGTARYSSSGEFGVLYAINIDGSNFRLLHDFAEGSDGRDPQAGLTRVGSTLFGVTLGGGAQDVGTVFRIEQDGSGYQVLHTFLRTDGGQPLAELRAVGSRLYGAAASGGAHGVGLIFSINQDGSDYRVLHEFSGKDGGGPLGQFVLDGTTLYGVTNYGGSADGGTIYKMDLDGGGYQELHSFMGRPDDGIGPLSGLLLDQGKLYGTAWLHGARDGGVVYAMNTDGSNYHLLHSFAGGPLDGREPLSQLMLLDGLLYGTTSWGGAYDYGTLFRLPVPEPSGVCLGLGALAAFALGQLVRSPSVKSR